MFIIVYRNLPKLGESVFSCVITQAAIPFSHEHKEAGIFTGMKSLNVSFLLKS